MKRILIFCAVGVDRVVMFAGGFAAGSVMQLWQFTSSLAGAGRYVLGRAFSLYDNLTSAEGALQFAGDIKRSLNRMLPDVGGEVLYCSR